MNFILIFAATTSLNYYPFYYILFSPRLCSRIYYYTQKYIYYRNRVIVNGFVPMLVGLFSSIPHFVNDIILITVTAIEVYLYVFAMM